MCSDTLVDLEVEGFSFFTSQTSLLSDVIVLARGTWLTSECVVIPVVGQIASDTSVTIPERCIWWAVSISIDASISIIVVIVIVAITVIVVVIVTLNASIAGEIEDLIRFAGQASLLSHIIVLSWGAGFTYQTIMVPVVREITIDAFLAIPEGIGAVGKDSWATWFASIHITWTISIVIPIVSVSVGCNTEIKVEIKHIAFRAGETFLLVHIIVLLTLTFFASESVIVPVAGQETGHALISIPEGSRVIAGGLAISDIDVALSSICPVGPIAVSLRSIAHQGLTFFAGGVEDEVVGAFQASVGVLIPVGVLRALHTLVVAAAPETALEALLALRNTCSFLFVVGGAWGAALACLAILIIERAWGADWNRNNWDCGFTAFSSWLNEVGTFRALNACSLIPGVECTWRAGFAHSSDLDGGTFRALNTLLDVLIKYLSLRADLSIIGLIALGVVSTIVTNLFNFNTYLLLLIVVVTLRAADTSTLSGVPESGKVALNTLLSIKVRILFGTSASAQSWVENLATLASYTGVALVIIVGSIGASHAGNTCGYWLIFTAGETISVVDVKVLSSRTSFTCSTCLVEDLEGRTNLASTIVSQQRSFRRTFTLFSHIVELSSFGTLLTWPGGFIIKSINRASLTSNSYSVGSLWWAHCAWVQSQIINGSWGTCFTVKACLIPIVRQITRNTCVTSVERSSAWASTAVSFVVELLASGANNWSIGHIDTDGPIGAIICISSVSCIWDWVVNTLPRVKVECKVATRHTLPWAHWKVGIIRTTRTVCCVSKHKWSGLRAHSHILAGDILEVVDSVFIGSAISIYPLSIAKVADVGVIWHVSHTDGATGIGGGQNCRALNNRLFLQSSQIVFSPLSLQLQVGKSCIILSRCRGRCVLEILNLLLDLW